MFISQANVPKNYIDGYYKDFLIENVTLRLGLLVWAVYLCVKGRGAVKGWIGLMVLVLGGNFPVSLLLHVTGIADFNKTLILPVAAMLILSLLQFYVDVVSKKAGSRRYRMAAGVGIKVFLAAFFLGLCSKLQFFLVGNDMLLPSAFLVYSIVMCTAFIIASYDIAAEQVRTSKELNQAKNRLKVEYEIETVNFFVPPLSVQVFVENAIKHGIGQKEEGGTVTIKIHEKDGDHIVVILDNGTGFDTSILEKEGNNVGIGIKNAVYRLKELADATVDICSEPGEGSRVTIVFPEKPEKGDQKA